MNKLALCCIVAFCGGSVAALGQISGVKPEEAALPVLPLIKPMQDGSGWVKEAIVAKNLPPRRESVLSYFSNRRRETIRTREDGSKEIEYWAGGMMLTRDAFTQKPVVDTRPRVEELKAKEDQFHDALWVRPEHFRGVVTYEARPCYLFQEADESGGILRQLFIDRESGFPVLLETRQERWRFRRVPGKTVVLPQEYDTLLKSTLDSIQKRRLKYAPR